MQHALVHCLFKIGLGTVPLINETFKKNYGIFIQQNKNSLFLPFMPATIAKAYRTEKLG